MAKRPIEEECFQKLLDFINHETCSANKKFEKFYYSKGCFNGCQAARILSCYKSPPEKLKIIKVLEPRLCRMTCAEGREILNAFSLTDNDRLFALDCIKRTLIDHQCTEGMEYILSAYEFERDKLQALGILQTISSYVGDQMGAGGHQGYAAVGGLYTQNWPLDEHLYGPLEEQIKRMPGQGEPALGPGVQPGRVPSLYTSHPSYAYPVDIDPASIRGYPGCRGFPENTSHIETYPSGAPPLGMHQGGPTATGFAMTE